MKNRAPSSTEIGSTFRLAVFFALLLGLAESGSAQTNQPVSLAGLPPTPPAGGNSLSPVISADGRYVAFASSAKNLVTNAAGNPLPASSALVLNVYLRDRLNQTTALVSWNAAGTGGGNDNSWPVAVSTNGQFVLFESAASNLIPGDTNGANDVFVRDVMNGVTTLVSVNTNGVSGNGESRNSVMTPDGRFVAFGSLASDLTPGDTNQTRDVFVRDTQMGVTTLVSVGAFIPAPNTTTTIGSDFPQITPDGRFVVFSGPANFLFQAGFVSGDDVYVRDLLAGTTILASINAHLIVRNSGGSTNAPLVCFNARISDDGQRVAYQINGIVDSRIGGTVPNIRGAVARYNMATGLTDVINTNAYGYYFYDDSLLGSDISPRLDISSDGRFVAFIAFSNAASTTITYAYAWDGQSNTTTLATSTYFNSTPASSTCDFPVLDSTGRYLAYFSNATNITRNVIGGGFHLYVRDLQLGTNFLVDADTNGVGSISNLMCLPQMTPDGRYIAFQSLDGSFTANDSNHAFDIFVRDITTNTTELISARAATLPSASANGFSRIAPMMSVSTNARFVAFMSDGDNLTQNDTNGYRDVFVRDLLLGTNILVSYDTNGFSGAGGPSVDPVISGEGRYVAFSSGATNLIANDTNKVADVFVRDLQTGNLTLASVSTNGGVGIGTLSPAYVNGGGASVAPQISRDGRYVVFHSTAQNLVPAGSSPYENIFLRDTLSATTVQLSSNNALYPMSVAMSPDARFIAVGGINTTNYVWDMQSTNLLFSSTNPIAAIGLSANGARFAFAGNANGSALVGVDLTASTNIILGTTLLSSHQNLRFSADGHYLVYVAANGTGTNQVWSYDFVSGINLLISKAYNSPLGGNGNSDSPDISSDARFIAYRSVAPNIVPGDTNNAPDVFLYDTANATTILVSLSALGNFTGNSRSGNPQFSPDGQTLLFQSWATDLTAQDYNQSGDIYALSLYSSNFEPAFNLTLLPPSGGNPLITWPIIPGRSYQVQFKNDLMDANWQSVNGNVAFVGNNAYAADLAPAPVQRFYRVVGH